MHTRYHGKVGCFERLYLPAPSGRNRYHVLGALDALTKEGIPVANDTTISAPHVCALVRQRAERADGMPLTVVLDNARSQTCRRVIECASDLGIELLPLPSYSPQVNLIERLWRWVRKRWLYGQFYATFAAFCGSLNQCLETAHDHHRAQLEDLFSWRFQSFANVKSLPV